MTVIKVLRTGQVTLPEDLRRRFHLGKGAALEAVEVEGGILLRPLADAAARGWQRVLSVVEQDK
jgi:AbrB family looped-hinge helix DNA binding protein